MENTKYFDTPQDQEVLDFLSEMEKMADGRTSEELASEIEKVTGDIGKAIGSLLLRQAEKAKEKAGKEFDRKDLIELVHRAGLTKTLKSTTEMKDSVEKSACIILVSESSLYLCGELDKQTASGLPLAVIDMIEQKLGRPKTSE